MSTIARLDPRTWPIRWQLTALNVGVHAATLVVLSAVFLAQLDGALVGLTAENMRDKVRLLAEDRRAASPTTAAGRRAGRPASAGRGARPRGLAAPAARSAAGLGQSPCCASPRSPSVG